MVEACVRIFPIVEEPNMNEQSSTPEPIEEDARIDTLDQRLKAVREREEKRLNPSGEQLGTDANYRMGGRVLTELIGAIGGGALIGWVIDQFAGTSPWGLMVLLFFGIVVAFRNIIRISDQGPK